MCNTHAALLLSGDCDSLMNGEFLKAIGRDRNSGILRAVENDAFEKPRRQESPVQWRGLSERQGTSRNGTRFF